MMSSTRLRCSTSSVIAGPWRSNCQKKLLCMFSERPAMMLSSAVMPRNSATFWNVRAMPPHRRLVRAHLGARRALEGDAAVLRRVEAVDDVEHRGLAGAVRPDDRADLALADIERDVGDRLHAAERERDVLDREHRLAGRDLGAGRVPSRGLLHRLRGHRIGLHVADRDARRERPLRPSSNVTSVEISASFEPS